MKTIIALSLLLVAPNLLWAQKYTLKPSPGAKISVFVDKGGVMSGKRHDFVFSEWSGTLDFNAKQPTDSKVSFVIDAKSIQCFDDWSPAKGSIDKIVKFAVDEVLQVQKFPQIRFVSNQVDAESGDQFLVTGNLTLRGITKPAKVRVNLKSLGSVQLFQGSTKIDMREFGIKPPTAALGTVKTKPEMQLVFNLKAEL
jgi:polyisoprenoid-binding protein YceI